jgi:hypothetical protein
MLFSPILPRNDRTNTTFTPIVCMATVGKDARVKLRIPLFLVQKGLTSLCACRILLNRDDLACQRINLHERGSVSCVLRSSAWGTNCPSLVAALWLGALETQAILPARAPGSSARRLGDSSCFTCELSSPEIRSNIHFITVSRGEL